MRPVAVTQWSHLRSPNEAALLTSSTARCHSDDGRTESSRRERCPAGDSAWHACLHGDPGLGASPHSRFQTSELPPDAYRGGAGPTDAGASVRPAPRYAEAFLGPGSRPLMWLAASRISRTGPVSATGRRGS